MLKNILMIEVHIVHTMHSSRGSCEGTVSILIII